VACKGKLRDAYWFFARETNEKDDLQDLGVDGRILLFRNRI